MLVVPLLTPEKFIVESISTAAKCAEIWLTGRPGGIWKVALPSPDSFENMPLATPIRIDCEIVAPRNPPVAAMGLNAW